MYWQEFLNKFWNTSLFGADYWGAIGFILVITIWLVMPFILVKCRVRWGEVMKWLNNQWMQFPYRLAIAVFLIGCFVFWTQYRIYEDMKNESGQQIEELQDKLSSITHLEYQLPTIKNQILNTPDTANIIVTMTPEFNPDYLSKIEQPIYNPDPYNHIFQIVRFKLDSVNPKYTSQVKFTWIDPIEIPKDVIIWEGYSGTQYAYVTIKDLAPLDTISIPFLVYAMVADSDIKDTIVLTPQIMDTKVIP